MRACVCAVLVLTGLLVACGEGEPERTAPAPARPAPAATPPSKQRSAPEPRADDRRLTGPGIVIELAENGTVRVSGTDRWGGLLDITYEDATYFRNAAPVLARSLTPEQNAVLNRALERL